MTLLPGRSATQDRVTGAEAATREERKYPFPAARAALLTAWLDARLPRDPRYPQGVITSCYYDTPELDAYQESADGEFRKRKLRLRWYGDPIDPLAGVWLEVKSREGVRSFKQRARFPTPGVAGPLEVAIPSRDELVAWLRTLDEQSGPLLDPTIEPTALIRYRRIRWQSTDRRVRASLDTDVHAATPRGAPIWLPIRDGSVLELKSEGDLPLQLAHLARLELRRTAHSKYALAVERLYGGERPRAR